MLGIWLCDFIFISTVIWALDTTPEYKCGTEKSQDDYCYDEYYD